jgi:hypothetical protein
MPQAVWLGEQSPGTPMSRYDIVCVHTIVGYAPAHAAHFSTKADGTIQQSRDTAFRSAANLDGNHRILAIENEDHGPRFGGAPTNTAKWPPLTDEQVEACAQILAWAHKVHGVPLQLCPDSRPGSRGLAYHRQGIDGNFGPGTAYPARGRVSGGEVWTSSPGKVCPGDARINQLPAILARAKQIITPEDDMADKATQDTLASILSEAKRANNQLEKLRESSFRRDAAVRGLVKDALTIVRADANTDKTVVAKLEAIEQALTEEDK